ncbi:MAG: hypothetical protein VX737_05825 [Pseudomonadota bacterium]|nr:hypothetical protein [Pseudomonadota bacterium]
MNTLQLRTTLHNLVDTLKKQMHEQLVKDPYGGRALAERLKNIVGTKILKKLNEEDIASLAGQEELPIAQLLSQYLTSLVSPATLNEEQVDLINKIAGDSKVTKSTKDIRQRFGYLAYIDDRTIDIGGNPVSIPRLADGMKPKFELSDDKRSIVAKLTHPEAKLHGKIINLLDPDVETPKQGYGYVPHSSRNENVPPKLSHKDVEASKLFMNTILARINHIRQTKSSALGGKSIEKTAGDVLDFINDSKKVDVLFDKMVDIQQTLDVDRRTLEYAFPKQLRDKVTLSKEYDILFLSRLPKKIELKADDFDVAIDESDLQRINEINQRPIALGTVKSDDFEAYLDLPTLSFLLPMLKYISAGQYNQQNDILENAGISELIKTIDDESILEKQFQAYKAQKTKVFNRNIKAHSKEDKPRTMDLDSDLDDNKPRNEKEVLDIIDSYADAIKAVRAELVKSDDYLAFLKESKKIDSFLGKIKTLFDSRRAISRPLYGFLTALFFASAAFFAPVPYTASVTTLALSALTYAAGKLLTIRDISARQKIQMSEVSSDAITVGSQWEIGTAIASTVVASLLGPLGLAARYSIYLGEAARAAISILVSTSVSLKELTVNMKTPLLMSGVDMHGSVSQDDAINAFVTGKESDSYIYQLTETAKSLKLSDFKDFKVHEKVENEEVRETLNKSAVFVNQITAFGKAKEPNMQDVKILVERVTRFVDSSQFKTTTTHDQVKFQPKGRELLRQITIASGNFVNAVKLVRGASKANVFNKETYEANLDFGLTSLVPAAPPI